MHKTISLLLSYVADTKTALFLLKPIYTLNMFVSLVTRYEHRILYVTAEQPQLHCKRCWLTISELCNNITIIMEIWGNCNITYYTSKLCKETFMLSDFSLYKIYPKICDSSHLVILSKSYIKLLRYIIVFMAELHSINN